MTTPIKPWAPWACRTFCIIVGPPMLVWAFVSTLIGGTLNAVHYAWLEVVIEWGSLGSFWHTGRFL